MPYCLPKTILHLYFLTLLQLLLLLPLLQIGHQRQQLSTERRNRLWRKPRRERTFLSFQVECHAHAATCACRWKGEGEGGISKLDQYGLAFPTNCSSSTDLDQMRESNI